MPPRTRGTEEGESRVGSRSRKSNGSDGSKRLILIIACIVLAVLCVLLLFQTCKGGGKKPGQGTGEQGKVQLVYAQFFIYDNVTKNEVSYPSHYNFEYQTSNSINATATDILNLIVLNANRTYGDNTWVIGAAPASSETLNFINYNYTCYQALMALVKQWNLQWSIAFNQSTGNYVINIYPKQAGVSEDPGKPKGSGGDVFPNTDYDEGKGKTPAELIGDSPSSPIISIVSLVILLAAYITARVKSNGGDLIITANVFDKILILLSPVLFFIAWCIGIDHELTEAQITLLVLSGIMLQGSIVFSIIANKGNWLNIILSILAKLFIFVLTNILLLLFVVILVFSVMRTIMGHSSTEGTYIVKYDHFLDQWVGYRVD